MNETRITCGMNEQQIVGAMSENSPGAAILVAKMLDNTDLIDDILLLDDLNIYGTKLYNLYCVSSRSNVNNFFTTLKLLRTGKFDLSLVHENLNSENILPLLDDSINDERISLSDDDIVDFAINQSLLFTSKVMQNNPSVLKR